MEGEEFVKAVGGLTCKTCLDEKLDPDNCIHPRTKKEAEEKNIKLRVDTITN